jgi:PadR family transcriptional regulator, regulatory protein PadR
MKELTKIEEILLVTIWRLREQAYGVKIRQQASRVLGKEFTYGNLYSVLHQLAAKKYVVKTLGESAPSRRGRPRVFYAVAPPGLDALQSSLEMHDKLWTGIPGLVFDRDKNAC